MIKLLENLVSDAGGQLVSSIPQVGIAVAVSSDAGFADAMNGVKNVSEVGLVPAYSLPETVEYAVADSGLTANDDHYNNGLLWGIDRVNAPSAWNAGFTGSHDTTVAVMDTGIAWNHPDLAQNVNFVACYTSMGSWEGPYSPVAPYNPYLSYSDHGTHVAGTVAAAFDGGGAVGVAPNLGLAGYNIFEPIPGCGTCAYSDTRWEAMVDAADRGFDVITMSLGDCQQFGHGMVNAF